MKTLIAIKQNPNIWGSFASGLCLVHCLATPFLFVAHTGHIHGHHAHPFWLGLIDMLFLIISFFAVYWSAHHTAKQFMRYALWVSWVLLAVIIINEKVEMVHLVEEMIYLPSFALIVLHLYNKKYCQCTDDRCCS